MNDNTKITAGDRSRSNALYACLTLITDFVPYRWNAAENYKYFSLCNYRSESHSHKGCSNKEARKPKCANCKGPHVVSYKGCPEYKKQAFRQHVVNKRKCYAAAISQKLSPPTQITLGISIYSQATNKICSKCGNSNCPTTGMLPSFHKPKQSSQ